MNLDSLQTEVKANVLQAQQEIRISRWANETLPVWDQVLTAHDVARLARRPPWWLCGMALLRQSPKKRTVRGQEVHWLNLEVTERLRLHARTRPLRHNSGGPEPRAAQ